MDDFGLLVGRYFSTLPTLTDEQLSELQLDSSGRLIIAGRFEAGSDSYSSGDSGVSIHAVRNDTLGPLTDIDDGDYTPLQVDSQGRLYVNAQVTLDSGAEKDEDAAHSSGDQGNYILGVRADSRPTDANTDTDGDYASFFINGNGELYVHDADSLAELLDQGTTLDNIETELNDQGTTLDSIETEVLDQGTSLDNIETELLDQGTTLDSVESEIQGLSHDEDAAHTSGDAGFMPLAVRADSDGSLVDADGDYAPFQVDASGKLKVSAEIAIEGSEAFTVTDGLAAAGDGLETITASGTPWVDVATLSVGAGTTAYVYGWQFACDQNCQARIVTDDTTDVIVYKTSVNSSGMPSVDEHFSEPGRIEIAGAASLEVKLQIKKRSATGGDANGTGSMHIRTV